ncbi:MAG: restriction endonuclease subunit S [bacterium]
MAINLSEKQIQKGWQVVKFGDIAKEFKQSTKTALEDGLEFYIGLDHLDPLSLCIQRKGVIAEDNPSFTRMFKPGHILFGKRRCYQKKAAVADFEGICSGDIIVMEAISGKIVPELLPFIVQSDMFFNWAEKTSSGSLSPRTKWKALAEFEFPLPPIGRQKEILEVLEKLEALNEYYESAIHSYNEFVAIKINHLISHGNYDTIKKQIFSGRKKMIIDKMKIERAEDFCHSVADGTHESPKPSKTGYPLITSKSLKSDGIDFSDSYLISESDYNSINKRSWVEPGDILFAMIGTIGNPIIIKKGEENIATKNVGIFRFNGNHYKSTWFFLFLNSSLGCITK